VRLNDPLLVDHKAGQLATAPTPLGSLAPAPARARLLHPARLDLGPTLEPLQPRYLLAQRRVLFQQFNNQPFEVIQTKAFNIWGRSGHGRTESQKNLLVNLEGSVRSRGTDGWSWRLARPH
jgi:hypothetical protein